MIGMIWAEDSSGMIGSADHAGLLWHVPEDLAHFKFMTSDHVVVMGRKTWESLPDKVRPLPSRKNLVLTSDPTWSAHGVTGYRSVDQVIRDWRDFWVIGGSQAYQAFLPYASYISRTVLDAEYGGDIPAPVLDDTWEPVPAHKRNPRYWRTSTSGVRFKIELFQKF